MKLYIVSNRLPVKVSEQEGRLLFARSEGGLATGLDSLHTDYEKHWIGWPGFCPDGEECRRKTADELEALRFHPVFLTAGQIPTTTKVTATARSGPCATTSSPIPATRRATARPTAP